MHWLTERSLVWAIAPALLRRTVGRRPADAAPARLQEVS